MAPKKLTTAIWVSEELLRDGASDAEALLAARIGGRWTQGMPGDFVGGAAWGPMGVAEPSSGHPAAPEPDHVVGDARECCDRCGALTETEAFESWSGPLDICAECRPDAETEE